jgi:hypothetical protein
MRARHVMGEAALIDVNHNPPRLLISFNPALEDAPLFFVRLGMAQRFFYSSRPDV